jgi:hypothetical protein
MTRRDPCDRRFRSDPNRDFQQGAIFRGCPERRDDLGLPDRFDIHYGMVKKPIGVARLDVPEILPPIGLADPSRAKGELFDDGPSRLKSRRRVPITIRGGSSSP